MKTSCINNTNFHGKLVALGKYSKKPEQSINLACKDINKLIKSKDYNLYMEQDYSKNIVKMACGNAYPFDEAREAGQANIQITANAIKYVNTAKLLMREFDANIKQKREKEWEKEQDKAAIKDMLRSVAFIFALPFMFIAEGVKDGIKDLKRIFNK